MMLTRMAILPLALFGLNADSNSDQPTDAARLLRAIDALQAPLQDFYCEYEGERLENEPVLGNESGMSRALLGDLQVQVQRQIH